MAEPVAMLALAIDAAVGWPNALYRRIGHPVGVFAFAINRAEARWNRPDLPAATRRLAGVATMALIVAGVALAGWAAQWLSFVVFGTWGWLAVAAMAWPALAQRSLFVHVKAVARTLHCGDMRAAREAVSAIVGRDTHEMQEAPIARAAIESLAESFCDGIVAPLFGLLILGLPGIWVYKAVNTADSLIGHREQRWRAFGWAAARTDDGMNLIPARLAAIAFCIVGGGGWRIAWRDAAKHTSPNAGWPEAAMAGALHLRLGGPIRYDGVLYDKPWIGDGSSQPTASDIDRALRIYVRGCLLLWFAAGMIEWAR
ncbi:MAG: adenosylcobinamide-phosphate synthase CbiB [Tsuneonella suprasediminis]|uniref:Cobalamin biosynthesis protein CobD n=1 Tax=Tsuneonella suprasediminis TaxID=2306996 RepID=A0A419R3P9_9SPHN|nr:adenosylcobinamide-phosphate synthase CbiB [Tsuneonella suprasediminis]RJX69163.1 cobalamin biosynthesis protein CobD [Tsuneonella suprasediminis]UBS34164.1 adenosylcobinamide-phosphate synthase CbiB [Altererythrobacter sp. N1]